MDRTVTKAGNIKERKRDKQAIKRERKCIDLNKFKKKKRNQQRFSLKQKAPQNEYQYSSTSRLFLQQKISTASFSRMFESVQNTLKFSSLSGFQLFKQQDVNRQNLGLSNMVINNPFMQAISAALERTKKLEIEDAILNVNTHQRKRSKVKREKLKQRRKKIRRLSERKREKYNY